MSGLATRQAEAWLYGKLAGAPGVTAVFGTRIYRHWPADAATTSPVLLLIHQSALDAWVFGPTRLGTRLVFLIKGVVQGGDYDAMDAGLDAAWDLLESLAGAPEVSGGWRFTVHPSEGEIEQPEVTTGGPLYWHVGKWWPLTADVAA